MGLMSQKNTKKQPYHVMPCHAIRAAGVLGFRPSLGIGARVQRLLRRPVCAGVQHASDQHVQRLRVLRVSESHRVLLWRGRCLW